MPTQVSPYSNGKKKITKSTRAHEAIVRAVTEVAEPVGLNYSTFVEEQVLRDPRVRKLAKQYAQTGAEAK